MTTDFIREALHGSEAYETRTKERAALDLIRQRALEGDAGAIDFLIEHEPEDDAE